jgi:branched-chain amino acid transport system substrate-binding protein
MRKLCLFLFLALAASLMAKETIKIGLILQMTGDNAFLGEDMSAAVRLLQEDLKTMNTAFDYQFLIEDDGLVVRRTVEAAHKLVNTDKVDILLPSCAQSGNAVKPFVQKQGVLMISTLSTDTSIADGKLCFTSAARPCH